MAEKRGIRKVMVGVVVSDKMDKTVVVQTTTLDKHAAYGKFQRRIKKVQAHDERNECHEGDRVEMIETRPLSRNKCWRVTRVLERAE